VKASQQHLRRRSNGCEGAALISVLCLLSLLTVLAMGALNATRRHAQLAQTSFLQIQQRELADSALRLAILEFTAPERGASAPAVGQRTYQLFGNSITVDVHLEAGRIDLNFASELLLVAAFAGNAVEEREARALAARIVDWRDADDSAGTRGAERSDYRRANRVGPRNGPFENVSELLLVLDAERLPESLLEMFTVYSHLAEVRERAATPEVMNALRWAQAKQLGGRTWLSEGAPADSGNQQPGLAGEILHLRACTAAALATCRTAIVRLTGDRSNPALVFAWR